MRIRLTIAAAVATLLASAGLYPLYEAAGWFGSGLGAVLTSGVAGLLTRRLRLPPPACLAGGAVALLLLLNALFAADRALLGLIPTPGSVLALARLAGDGWHDANTYAAPVPMLPGIDLLSAAGIGAIAVLVDFLAVRLRRAASAGLPLLALYGVPAAVRDEGTNWLIFLMGAAGYLALLVVDARERLSGWGRPVFTRRWAANRTIRESPDSSALAVTGRRVGLTAVVIAIVVPMAVPSIQPTGLFGTGRHAGKEPATVTTPDPLVSLKRQLVRSGDAVVLTYRTTDGSAPDYLRMYSLDRFEGDGWTYSPLRGGRNARVAGRTLPSAPGLAGAAVRPARTEISIDRHVRGMSVLPTPYPPTKVDIRGDWRIDAQTLMVFSLHDAAGGRSYTVSSLRPTPTYQQLETTAPPPMAVAARYLVLPDALPREITDLAHRLTASASTPYEKAVKLQGWFTRPGNFTYSLSTPPPRGVGALRDFLLGSKTGYCEQFAASMALLARIAGIPARVGVGYTAGTRQGDGTWVVRTRDTHAWPELYFTGVGWLRFEPTPAGGGGQGTATVPDYATLRLVPGSPIGGTRSRAPSTVITPGTGTTPGTRPATRHRGDALENGGSAGTAPRSTRSPFPAGWLLVVIAVVPLLTLPAALRYLAGVRRWARTGSDAAAAHAAWDELRAGALDFGLPWRAGDSPRAAARRLGESRVLGGETAAALNRLARAEELARYAPVPGPSAGLREDARAVRAAFAAGSAPGARWRARLVPPSATAALRGAGGRLLDAFDRLDSLTFRRRGRASG